MTKDELLQKLSAPNDGFEASVEALEEAGLLEQLNEKRWFSVFDKEGRCHVWEKSPTVGFCLQRVDPDGQPSGPLADEHLEREKFDAAKRCAEWDKQVGTAYRYAQDANVGQPAEQFMPAITEALRGLRTLGNSEISRVSSSVRLIEVGERRCVLVTAVMELEPKSSD